VPKAREYHLKNGNEAGGQKVLTALALWAGCPSTTKNIFPVWLLTKSTVKRSAMAGNLALLAVRSPHNFHLNLTDPMAVLGCFEPFFSAADKCGKRPEQYPGLRKK
jgi:hypothetical protein